MNESIASAKTPDRDRTICARLIRFFRFGDAGGALVEMALVMPILLCMLTGIFSFSAALYQKLQLAEALSSAGRVLAADRGNTDPCADAVTALDAASPGLSSSSIGITITIDGISYGSNTSTVSCPGVTGTSGATTGAGGANNPNMPAGTTATIQATYPCSLSIYNVSGLSCAIGAQIAEVVQ
ncbi:MAG: TadE/TadG family type IV pilus assembly protein [Terracidiphilus sp.]